MTTDITRVSLLAAIVLVAALTVLIVFWRK